MMKIFCFLALAAVALSLPLPGSSSVPDLDFGYVDTAKGAHMFYVIYGAQTGVREKLPTILWLQGGPGGSSTGFGNFGEIGPLDVSLNPREKTWNKQANLLFVDQPVGTGYSYVDDASAYTRNQQQINEHLLVLIKAVFTRYPTLQDSPFYIFCESYGGKMAASFGVALHEALAAKELAINFKGVALGDSWVSPIACMESYGPFLNAISEITDVQQKEIDAKAALARQQIQAGQLEDATNTWSDQQRIIMAHTGDVNFYNYMEHGGSSASNKIDPYRALRAFVRGNATAANDIDENALDKLMNGAIKQQWKIPSHVVWGSQSGDVFSHLAGDFMTDVVSSVSELLKNNYKVVIYNGALDVIVDTPCVTSWMKGIQWEGLDSFNNAPRTALFTDAQTQETQGFRQIYKNLQFWTLLKAGHMVPSDMPELALQMFDYVTELNN